MKRGILSAKSSLFEIKHMSKGIPLALPTLAALTPKDVQVEIIDENIELIDFEKKVDLVGITFNISGVIRAYEIADEFRKRGSKVILGGIYASMLSEEASLHADSIVIGEAEEVWPIIINDFAGNKLQKIYRAKTNPDLSNSPIPRWDLVKSKFYHYHSLQTTRGCPFNCDYCSVTWFFGGKYRHKPVEKIVDEIKFIRSIDKNKMIFFVDDNIVASPTYAKSLFKALIPLKIKWYSQAPINIAYNDELLDLMHESGCRELFIGFESLSQESLNALGKGKVNKAADYIEAVRRIYSHGISIFGSFMFGGDYDDDSIFKRTTDFINKVNMPFALLNILVPPPGTRLFKRLEKEGRILHRNWEYYTGEFVCFVPRLMPPEKLQQGFIASLKEIYNYDSLYLRLTLWWTMIRQGKKSRGGLKKFFLKIYFTLSILLRWKDAKRTKFFLKGLWLSGDIPLSLLFLAGSFHDYVDNFKPNSGYSKDV
ncbi:MAG: radical SAM protein [Candidatus Omnitrophica bacterium]|nr:radical SAM protein [Candidatus Omnitrophota bacterium]